MSSTLGLFVKETGLSGGIPIVLIHGGGGALWTWDEVVPLLHDYRCILPDLPEHGQTGLNVGPFSISGSADLLADLIRQRSPTGKAHVVGLSVGAQIGVEMLAKTPDVLESAVISSAQLCPEPGDGWGIYSESAMAAVYWLGIAPFKHSDRWIRMNMKYSAGIPGRYFEAFRRNFQSITRDGWAHVMADNFRYRLPDGLGKAHLPVLLVAGTKETGTIRVSHQLLAEKLPNAKAVLIGNHKTWSVAQEHNWPMNDPAVFARMVRAWVEGEALPPVLEPMEARV
jgi:pimeloyl-ACP methyl ester carboxylesterase